MKAFYLVLIACCLAFAGHAQLVLNEVCYDPSNTNLNGDTNGDGVYDQTQDEFVELVNVGTSPIDLSKYRICDVVIATNLKTVRHTIAPGTILGPGGAVVIFGGGTAVGTFGNALVFVDRGTQGLSLGNSGERVVITDSSGVGIDSLDTDALSDNPNESYTRNPDMTGAFVQHGTARAGVLFSPGLKVSGSPFSPQTALSSEILANIKVYPNPVQNRLFIETNLPEGVQAELINAIGQSNGWQQVLPSGLDVSNISAGVYTLRLKNGTAIASSRLVVTH